ncbi:MAG: hypothetical protein ACI8Z9_001759, partial [Paraglaciecola sp.]
TNGELSYTGRLGHHSLGVKKADTLISDKLLK